MNISAGAATIASVGAPQGQLHFDVVLDLNGRAGFKVRRGHTVVMSESRLGVERADTSFATGLRLYDEGQDVFCEERYDLVVGKRRANEARWNERTVTFENTEGHRLGIEVRVFEDGVAFRYHFPERSSMSRTMTSELTTFAVPDGQSWLQPQDPCDLVMPAYEAEYVNGIGLAALKAPLGWTFPALFHCDGDWIALAEAGVNRTHCVTRLDNRIDGHMGILFPSPEEGNGIGEVEPTATTPWASAWRIIITSKSLATVAESNIVQHVNPPSRIADPSWIRPGRVAWSWWSDNDSPQNPEAMRRFVDLAVDMGWEHHLIDANWNLVDEAEIRELIDYATAKGIGTLLWYNSGGPTNDVKEQPRGLMGDRETRQAEFARIAAWGVAGVKVDFFQSDKQERVEAFRGILEDAADHQIMVVFHGCASPRGWEREWPHLMTMEAVRGAEQYIFKKEFTAEAPALNTILPYTRNVVGSMDYTPVTFTERVFPHATTSGHELALAVVFESGLQHFADSVESYDRLMPDAREALRLVPSVWDETVFLDGYPGRYVVVARRHEDTWWIGAINGLNTSLDLEIDVSRLKARGVFRLIEDEVTPALDGSGLRRRDIDASRPIMLPLHPRGGALAHLKAAQ